MNLYEDTDALLRSASFKVRRELSGEAVLFEDEVVFGAMFSYVDVPTLLRAWERNQDRFLQEYAPRIRRSASKSWNIYTVHLTNASVSKEHQMSLNEVEENFRGTRKIAKADVATREALTHALTPLLPLQAVAVMDQRQLSHRLETALQIAGPIKRAILQGANAEEIVRIALNTSEPS